MIEYFEALVELHFQLLHKVFLMVIMLKESAMNVNTSPMVR